MLSRDFCFWLQGYFELVEQVNKPTLETKQLTCVQNHLNLVFTSEESDLENKALVFCMSLSVDLQLHELGSRPFDMAKVRKQLNGVFIHEIDSSFKGDALKLQKIHDGSVFKEPRDQLMRC